GCASSLCDAWPLIAIESSSAGFVSSSRIHYERASIRRNLRKSNGAALLFQNRRQSRARRPSIGFAARLLRPTTPHRRTDARGPRQALAFLWYCLEPGLSRGFAR